MMERGVEVREIRSDYCENILIKSGRTDDGMKIWVADVVAGPLNPNVLFFAHVRPVVGFLIHPLPVEHVASESAFALVLSPLRLASLEINAQHFAFAHASNEAFTDEISDCFGCLATKSLLDDLRAESGMMALHLHVCAYKARFVPDEQVLVGCFGSVDGVLDLLKFELRPCIC